MFIRQTHDVKKLLLLAVSALFLTILASLTMAQDSFAQSAQFSVESGGKEIVATGQYVDQFFNGSGGFAESGVDSSFYNSGDNSITFKRERENFYVTHVTTFFNTGGLQGCYPAINTRVIQNGDGTSRLAGTVSGRLIVPGEGTLQNPNKTDADCAEEVRSQSELGSDLQIIGSIGDIGSNQDSLNGVVITSCSPGDGGRLYALCLENREQQIERAVNAVSCSTQSVAEIERCEQQKSETNLIAECLRENNSNVLSICRAQVNAKEILDGNLSIITAQTTDDEITAICDVLSSQSEIDRCSELATAERDRLVGDVTDGVSSCRVEGIGWIVCPVINFMANLADGAFGFLADNLLRTDPQAFNSDSGTYAAWSVMRNIANIAFVIVFLIIIFSQLTSLGISNYGVKKMLPRIVVAAILVNVSFFISQIAVDLSNILGYSIQDVLDGITSQVTGSPAGQLAFGEASPIADGSGFAGIAGGILAGAAVGVALYAMLSTLIPILLAALVALIMILFILTARQAIIILLVVLSPLAFVAFLLPNTEGLFKKWRQALTAMLLLFPIIALVFGASKLASAILSIAATESTGPDEFYAPLMASAVLVLPLFVVPILLKKSLDGIPALGQLANKFSSRANGALGKRMSESYQGSTVGRGRAIRKQARLNFRDKKFAEGLTGDSRMAKARRVLAGGVSSIGVTREQQAQKEALERAARGTAASAQSEAVKQEMILLKESIGTNPDDIERHIASRHSTMNATQMEAASDLMLEAGGVAQYRRVVGNQSIMQAHARSLVQSARRNDGEVRKKAADIANWASTADAAANPSGYNAASTVDATGKLFIKAAYETAEAAKLITMDPDTAALAEAHAPINKDQAKLATLSEAFSSAKKGTQDILTRAAR
ncbi:MAG TPA: hypothetical protein QF549_02505 [Candidatus Saccharimonadaceae bacterium]|nr:hypothetical protein [Candidatus Saccharimonadaceae bacterium]